MSEPVDLDAIAYFDGRPMYLDRAGQPMTLRQWAEAFEDTAGRLVARTKIGDAEVVTMWIGIDHDPFAEGGPLIFGSIVRLGGGGFGEEIESSTEEEAFEAHRVLVDRVASMIAWRRDE